MFNDMLALSNNGEIIEYIETNIYQGSYGHSTGSGIKYITPSLVLAGITNGNNGYINFLRAAKIKITANEYNGSDTFTLLLNGTSIGSFTSAFEKEINVVENDYIQLRRDSTYGTDEYVNITVKANMYIEN